MTAGDGGILRLLIADDHPIAREGLAAILRASGRFDVVALAASGAEALERYRALKPDVALLDLDMPETSGLWAVREILAFDGAARLLMLTLHDGDEDIWRALQAGAKSYLLKSTTPEELVRALDAVAAGRRYLPPDVSVRLAERMGAETLTAAELTVLRLVAEGLANKEVAARVGVTEGTIKSQLHAITQKLGVKNRTEAVLMAQRRGLLRV